MTFFYKYKTKKIKKEFDKEEKDTFKKPEEIRPAEETDNDLYCGPWTFFLNERTQVATRFCNNCGRAQSRNLPKLQSPGSAWVDLPGNGEFCSSMKSPFVTKGDI